MAKTVVVNWSTQDQVVPNAETADHYIVGLGTTEVSIPLTQRSHSFTNVLPGSYSGWVSIVNAADVELASPILYSVVVADDAKAPVPINVTAVAQ